MSQFAQKPWNLDSKSEPDTARFGDRLGRILDRGITVALIGGLGAGKTQMIKAVVGGLEADEEIVNSPTFVLIQQYQGRLPVYHCDVYRLSDSDEFLALGIDEIFESDGVCLIEWADRVLDILPKDHLRIEISVTGPSSRVFEVTSSGERSAAISQKLQESLAADKH